MSLNISILLSLSNSNSHQEAVATFLRELNVHQDQNPDLHFLNQPDEPLKIENVRQLTQEMSMQPYQSPKSTFIIFQIDKASLPAQNALLKSLEEPPAHVQLILTTDRLEQVLPTIQSRCLIKKIPSQSIKNGEETTNIEQLLQSTQASYSSILTLCEKYKDRSEALQLLQEMLTFFHQANQLHPRYQYVQAMRATLSAQDLLEKNINTRLAIEDLFFQLKTLSV